MKIAPFKICLKWIMLLIKTPLSLATMFFFVGNSPSDSALTQVAFTCVKLTIETLERCFGVFIANFAQVNAGCYM